MAGICFKIKIFLTLMLLAAAGLMAQTPVPDDGVFGSFDSEVWSITGIYVTQDMEYVIVVGGESSPDISVFDFQTQEIVKTFEINTEDKFREIYLSDYDGVKNRLYTSSKRGKLIVLDLNTLDTIPNDLVFSDFKSISVSGDGNVLATYSELGIKLYDTDTFQQLPDLKRGGGNYLHLNQDGTKALFNANGYCYYYDIANDNYITYFHADYQGLLSEDKNLIVVGRETKYEGPDDYSRINVVNAETGLVYDIETHVSIYGNFDISPDGNFLVNSTRKHGKDYLPEIYNLETGKLLYSYRWEMFFQPGGPQYQGGGSHVLPPINNI